MLAMKPIPILGAAYHLAEDEQQRVIVATKRPTTEAKTFQTTIQGQREIVTSKKY